MIYTEATQESTLSISVSDTKNRGNVQRKRARGIEADAEACLARLTS